jgi:hypothetical protein
MAPRTKSAKTTAIAIMLGMMLIGGMVTVATKAQSNNPLELIMAALSSLQASINAVVAADQTNVRITAPVGLLNSSQNVRCIIINVSASPRTIHFELLGDIVPFIGDVTVQPGSTFNALKTDPSGNVYCKLTVLDGTRTDIRGTLTVSADGALEPAVAMAAE